MKSISRKSSFLGPHRLILTLTFAVLVLGCIVFIFSTKIKGISYSWTSEQAQKICDLPSKMTTENNQNFFNPEVGDNFAFSDQGCAFSKLESSSQTTYIPDKDTFNKIAHGGIVFNADQNGLSEHSPSSLTHGGSVSVQGVPTLNCCHTYASLLGRTYGPFNKVWEMQISSDSLHGAVAATDENNHGVAWGPYASVDGQKGKQYSLIKGLAFINNPLRLKFYACDKSACYIVTRDNK